jgi:hypothetical protein
MKFGNNGIIEYYNLENTLTFTKRYYAKNEKIMFKIPHGPLQGTDYMVGKVINDTLQMWNWPYKRAMKPCLREDQVGMRTNNNYK